MTSKSIESVSGFGVDVAFERNLVNQDSKVLKQLDGMTVNGTPRLVSVNSDDEQEGLVAKPMTLREKMLKGID